MTLIAPSLLAADFGNLRSDIEMVNSSNADWFHVDIMDGRFVPNFSIGSPVIQAIKKWATKPLDVHLMILEPERYIDHFAGLGADVITVHYEATTHLNRTVHHIKDLGKKAGVSLNPHTSIDLLDDIISEVDLVLIMSVNPGFGGQRFIPHSLDKIKRLSDYRQKKSLDFWIEVDGGVDLSNAQALVHAGANVLVAGNSIFASTNPSETIRRLKEINEAI